MTPDPEIYALLIRHLQSIMENDVTVYRETTAEELTLYEWYVTPHRLEGLAFHEFMMQENARCGQTSAVPEVDKIEGEIHTRFDLANLSIQRYNDSAIACYTLLISSGTSNGVQVAAHNETRVFIHDQGQWKVVHVHKSPAWPAPHLQPR